MRVCCVVEGKTEYFALPKIVGRLGHIHVLTLKFDGGNNDDCPWDTLIKKRIVPRVLGVALKHPDKILVVCDREGRNECPPTLAKAAAAIIENALTEENIIANVAVIVCDRRFENLIMADTHLVDRFSFMNEKFSDAVGNEVDGKSVEGKFNDCCRSPHSYDKVLHGSALAQKMDLACPEVQQRSRTLRKLLKELQ